MAITFNPRNHELRHRLVAEDMMARRNVAVVFFTALISGGILVAAVTAYIAMTIQ
jgi:hypothetical protein